MIFFDGISILGILSINWDIQYDRNNQTYRMLIAVCRFVIKGLLQTTADGSTKIMDYADDQTMAKLYEKFILGYYQREHPELKAYSPQIAWQVTDGYRTLLPTMQSDIVITNKARLLYTSAAADDRLSHGLGGRGAGYKINNRTIYVAPGP